MKNKKAISSLLALFSANLLFAQSALPVEDTDKEAGRVVNLAYQKMDLKQTTGSVSVVNPDEVLKYDSRQDVQSALQNKITGLTGVNLHGMGDVVYVVDGVVKDIEYLNLLEIEQITVLKDAVSRVLYGADADTGVVLITTKKGDFGKNKMKFNAEYGLQKAIAYPKYLDAASYMEVYNRAYLNDGGP